MAEFYEVMFRHWEKQLKDMHEKRQARKQQQPEQEASSAIIIVEDDDGDGDAIIELEKKSLEEAEKGIIVDGYGSIDEIATFVEEETADPPASSGVSGGSSEAPDHPVECPEQKSAVEEMRDVNDEIQRRIAALQLHPGPNLYSSFSISPSPAAPIVKFSKKKILPDAFRTPQGKNEEEASKGA